MNMILLAKTVVNGKQFTIQDSQATVYLKNLGFPDNFYGGYVKELRKTKYGIYLLLDHRDNVINLGYLPGGLTPEGDALLFPPPTDIGGLNEPEEADNPAEFFETEPFPPIKPIETSFLKKKDSVGQKKNTNPKVK